MSVQSTPERKVTINTLQRMKQQGDRFASLTAYFVPVVAVLTGTFLFEEPLRPTALVSLALLACGVAIGQGGPWRRRDSPGVAVAASR